MPDDCKVAEETMTFRDHIKYFYQTFNIFKIKEDNDIKRIKEVRVYPGVDLENIKDDEAKQACDLIGGIDVVYETYDGEEVQDGLIDLACRNPNLPPVILELKEQEYIQFISGTGTTCVKSIQIITNQFRKIK